MTAGQEDDKQLKEELGEDYYAGYFWGNQPYRSSELKGHKTDKELESEVHARLEKLGLKLEVRVTNAVAILTGTVRDYAEKRKAGAEAWKTPGIAKVSNNLRISNADTAGPSAQ